MRVVRAAWTLVFGRFVSLSIVFPGADLFPVASNTGGDYAKQFVNQVLERRVSSLRTVGSLQQGAMAKRAEVNRTKAGGPEWHTRI